MDSLTSMELRNCLQSTLGCQLPAAVVFNHPTVEALAAYLAQNVVESSLLEDKCSMETPPLPQREEVSTFNQQPPQTERPIVPSSNRSAAVEAANSPSRRERMVEVADLSLCLCEWGTGNGNPIVCLHGTRDHGASWENVAATFIASGHRIIAPDLRGHGHSDHARPNGGYQLYDFVADLDQLIAQLQLDAVTLVGHSLGSIIALLYTTARLDRVSKLVLVEPTLPPTERLPFAEQLPPSIGLFRDRPRDRPYQDASKNTYSYA